MPKDPSPIVPQFTSVAARIRALQDRIDEGRLLASRDEIPNNLFAKWHQISGQYVAKIFDKDQKRLATFAQSHRGIVALENDGNDSGAKATSQRAKGMLSKNIEALETLKGILEAVITPRDLPGTLNRNSIPANKTVFLVHGHDRNTLLEVDRFLRQLELVPVILNEKSNSGDTIIEKFERYSDVRFAVVLLTGDDHGGPISDGFEKLKSRARQNVILELGYFIARLGRKNVCPICQNGVEIPSDISGVVYVGLDNSWRTELARELLAASFPVDINRIL